MDQRFRALIAAVIFSAEPVASWGQSVPAARASAPLRFDIPAQPLSSALEVFVTTTHVQVLSDRPAGSEPWSHGVSGTLTPEAALQSLVAGAGLTVRFTGANAAILEPVGGVSGAVTDDPRFAGAPVMALDDIQVKSDPAIGAPPKDRLGFRLYGDRVRQALWRALRQDAKTATLLYRTEIKVWLDARGAVQRVEVAHSSGRPDLDSDILRVLSSASAGLPPPQDMPQPVDVLIDNRNAQ